MKLIKPALEYEKQFFELLQEFDDEDVSMFWDKDGKAKDDIPTYIKNTQAYEKWEEFKFFWGKAYTFWLLDNNHLIWMINLREKAEWKYLQRWGHIWYAIRKSERGKWYAKKILALTLLEAKKIGLNKVLVTCNTDNIASSKVIEANGAFLENVILYKGSNISRYWIDLT